MPERFAIYYAPTADSPFWAKSQAWLGREDLQPLTESARRYGFHATLKAPMALADGVDRAALEVALTEFAAVHSGVTLSGLAPRMLDGFVALTTVPQPQALTDLAALVVNAFEPMRAPLSASERERRLKAPLTPRQVEFVDLYGYPYVLEEFMFHMTLTDRLPPEQHAAREAEAADWFAAELARPVVLDRLVLFHEAAPGEPFRRLDDYVLRGA
jgi:hypothetical protein